jgi:hypothetical protein
VALKRTFNPSDNNAEEIPKPVAIAGIPYISTISGKITRILHRHGIQVYSRPHQTLRNHLVHAKDSCGFQTPGVYQIPCECGLSYVGETGRTIETRIKEHRRHFRLGQIEKSAVAEHSITEDHAIHWDKARVLCHSNHYWERLTKEAIAIRLEKGNFNRDRGYNLSTVWRPILNRIKEEGKRRERSDQSAAT